MTTTVLLNEGRLLEPVGSPSRRQPFNEGALRRNINARAASFVESNLCHHREIAHCQCVLPSNEVMKKYIFFELSQQVVTADNFNSLFNSAVQNWGIPHDLRDTFSRVALEQEAQRKSEPLKRAALIILAALIMIVVVTSAGIFLYKKLFL